jgi:uncharacterized protein involved in response to NO
MNPDSNRLERRRRQTLSADSFFFPAAAAFALVAVPSWVSMVQGGLSTPSAYWHGHEMVFGYALAVVSGYLLTRVGRIAVGLLFASWLAARLAALGLLGEGLLGVLPGLIFAALAAYFTASPFLRAAKKPENRVFGPLFIGIGTCELFYQLGVTQVLPGAEATALLVVIDLFTLLLLLMGGRVIAPAVAGHFYRRGGFLTARVQPRLERTVIGFMLAMVMLDLHPSAAPLAGGCALGAAAITAVRAWRWRLWCVLEQPPLWTLGLGYGWLVPGLGFKGWAQVTGNFPLS